MRLWTLHPQYLDAKGLVALWREALLAQAVLAGKTRGYLHHPQLLRFRHTPSPTSSIAAYLRGVYAESTRRGYRFDASKIISADLPDPIYSTQGQLNYEWNHLQAKLKLRAPNLFTDMQAISHPVAHPLFCIVLGPVEKWEITTSHPKK